MAATWANTRYGMPTCTIGSSTFYTTGSAEYGIEGSTEFARCADLSVPSHAVIVSRQPFATIGVAEVGHGGVLDEAWDVTLATLCLSTNKTPTNTTVTLTIGGTDYEITQGVITSYGSISFGETECAGTSVTFTGYDNTGAGNCGSIAATS